MDLSLVQFEQDVSFTSLDATRINDAVVLVVTGPNYTEVARVLINDVEAEFDVVSSTQLYVTMPSNITELLSLRIVAGGPIQTTDPVKITWTPSLDRGAVYGISALVQRVLKVLLTRRGSNAFDRSQGAGLHGLVGTQAIDAGGGADLVVDRIQDTEIYLRADPNYSNLPADERLDGIDVLSSNWNRDTQTVELQIKITNALGQTAAIEVST